MTGRLSAILSQAEEEDEKWIDYLPIHPKLSCMQVCNHKPSALNCWTRKRSSGPMEGNNKRFCYRRSSLSPASLKHAWYTKAINMIELEQYVPSLELLDSHPR
jgi:hypothetical protein